MILIPDMEDSNVQEITLMKQHLDALSMEYGEAGALGLLAIPKLEKENGNQETDIAIILLQNLEEVNALDQILRKLNVLVAMVVIILAVRPVNSVVKAREIVMMMLIVNLVWFVEQITV